MVTVENEKVKELENKISYMKPECVKEIKEAANYIIEKHKNQYRKSGEPYYIHPIEAAKILADLKLDKTTIVAALLHDIVEDTDTTIEEIEQKFGKDVALIVNGVTKIGKYHFSSDEEAKAETFRKMIVSMSKDIRVLLVKLADRLHNIRTLQYLNEQKRVRIAKETLEIYAPLAARLGLWKIKSELEDTSFMYLDPENYKKITTFISTSKENQEKYLREKFVPDLEKALKENGIKAEISYRSKHIYSIYEKTIRKNLNLSDVFDVYGIRVIVDDVKNCYTVLGIIHHTWKPVPGKFKDYISLPKSNLYQALHTTVVGPEGKFVEIQIKTHEMHKISEEGIAAHWRYKGGQQLKEKDIETFKWLRTLLETVKESKDSSEFLSSVKNDLIEEEIFVFTPKGDLKNLPVNSTPVDFAYAIHTQVGHKCVGAKVNNKLVPLDTKLKSGDVVEIITSKEPKPNRAWLNFVVTSKAKNNIKHFLAKKERERAKVFGEKLLNKFLKKLNKKVSTLSDEEKEFLLNRFKYKNFEEFIVSIGEGKLSPEKVLKALRKEEDKPKQQNQKESSSKQDSYIEVDGINNVMSTIAKCCYPVPGDEIIGVVLKGRGISIHAKTCSNAKQVMETEPERIINVVWKQGNGEAIYPVMLRIISEDKPGLLANVAAAIASTKTNIVNASAKTNRQGQAITDLKINVKSLDHLNKIISSIQKVKGVKEIYRINKKR